MNKFSIIQVRKWELVLCSCKYKLCFTDDHFYNLFIALMNGSSVNVKKIITIFKVNICKKYFMFKYCNIYKTCVYFFENSSNPK